MGLTPEEANYFVTEVLQVGPVLEKERLSLLDDIIEAFQREIPFQNITACGTAPEKRHLPTWLEIKNDVFAKVGGLCLHLHVFLKELLTALGYDVYYAKATIRAPFDHIGLVAVNVSFVGSKHLVEAAGFPTFQAIPLDFEGFSEIYHRSFLRQKFEMRAGGRLLWYHEARYEALPFSKYEMTDDGFYKFAEYDINTPYTFDPFKPYLEKCFTVEGFSFVLECPKATKFVRRTLVAIKLAFQLSENEWKGIKRTQIENFDSYVNLFSEIFPEISREVVEVVANKYVFPLA